MPSQEEGGQEQWPCQENLYLKMIKIIMKPVDELINLRDFERRYI